MPTVQRYGERKVGTAPIPGVRKTAADTPASLGAGVGAAMAGVGAQVAQIGVQQFAELQAHERERADDVALMDAKNQLARWETDRLYDPETGALAQKGKNALGLPETLDAELATLTGEIEQRLNARQRDKFAKVKGDAGLNLHATIQRHIFGQIQAYEGEELQARIENGQSLAIANAMDPRRVGVELNSVIDDVKKSAPRLGLGPEQVKAQVEKITSATHVGVIERLLTNEQTNAAQIYFEETKGQIAGDAMARVEKGLEEGTLRGDSQKQADAIIAKGGTLTEQRAAVKAIEDPKLRDEVQQRVEHEAAVQEKITRDTDEATLTSAYNTIDQSHDVRAIPPATWAALPGNSRAALRAYAEHAAKGTPVETDLPTYYALMQQAAEDPETFVGQNLLNYKHKLDEVEFKQIAGLQLSIRSGDRAKADKGLDDFRTETSVINDALSIAGIEPTPADKDTAGKARVARFRGLVADEVRRVQDVTKKKATNDDLEAIAQRILAREITDKGWFWDSTRSLATAAIADVPPADRTQIEDALRRHGQPLNDDTVLDVWLKKQIRRGGP